MNQRSASPRWMFAVLGIFCLIFICSTISPAQQATAPATQEPSKVVNEEGLPPLPQSPIEKSQKDGTALPLSLKDVTKLALQNNLDIAIQDTNEQLSQQKIRAAYSKYDPTLDGTLSYGSNKQPTYDATQAAAAPFSKSNTASWNFTFAQAIRTGGNFSVQWNTTRSESNQYSKSFNPQYSPTATIQYTQPLLRNFLIDSTRANIKVVNLDLRTTESQFKQKVTDTIANIQTQYWALVSAIRDYDIKRNSLRSAQVQLRDNRRKQEVGTLAPIDVVDAEATMSGREVDMIASEESILTQENALRQLISPNRNSEIWSQVIVPTDKPDFVDYKVDFDTAINTALKNRPELEQSDINLTKYDINRKSAENERKWKLDVSGQLRSNGISGPQSYQRDLQKGTYILDDNGNKIPVLLPELIGGLGNSYKTVFTQKYINWSVNFSLNIPLRNRSVDSQIAQIEIQKRQELMRRKQTEQTIQVDVRNAIQQIETRKRQVQSAGDAKRFAQERLDGENKRFEAGLSQGYLVLQRQNEVASAEYQELQSLINYKRAVVNLQKAMYTLLEASDFEVSKTVSGKDTPDLK